MSARSTAAGAQGRPKTHNVGLGQMSVAGAEARLAIFGLGSCIGLVLWSPSIKTAVMSHIVLPSSKGARPLASTPAKFADWAIPRALDILNDRGATTDDIVAKMVGGAHPLAAALGTPGQKNAELIMAALEEEGISVVGSDIGGSVGRTVVFSPDTGVMEIKFADGSMKHI
ncbi:MAG: chemotaxis protein CheD [Limnochordia bacterium]